VLGVFQNPIGFEEMVMTIDGNQYQSQSLLIGHGMLNWVTKGLYLGHSRNHFRDLIDDIFMPDDRWDPDTNMTAEDGSSTIRMTAADVD